jgi:hypothetical protein
MGDERERSAAWQTAWWATDFSWDGLADKDWLGWSVTTDQQLVETGRAPDGARPASLQDYFRRDPASATLRSDAALMAAGLLVDTPGQPLFHTLHLPTHWPDGQPSWKADPEARDWPPLEAEISSWLEAARETRLDGWRPVGADRRAQLDGSVIRTLPHSGALGSNALHLRARHLCVLGDLDLAEAVFGPEADFTSARFDGAARFDSARFSEHGCFDKVRFNGTANFTAARFNANAGFADAAFAGKTLFDQAEIKGYADFEAAHFAGAASFREITIHDLTDFLGARIDGEADFSDANFIGEVDFGADCRGVTHFEDAKFSARTDFRCAHFHGATSFKGAVFKG